MADIHGGCPICDATIQLSDTTEISEIINCPECDNRIVVESIEGEKMILTEAPEIEEDWGE